MAKRLRQMKPGDVGQLASVLWRAVKHLERHLDDVATSDEPDSRAELCKLVHALSQSAGVYLKALETGELEDRIKALEAAQKAQAEQPSGRWAA